MGVLKIPQTPQYGVLLEETYGKTDSLFHDVYVGAAENVYDIINVKEESKKELFCNPCIAFVGKRGTGKSSAMISFSNFLEESKDKDCSWIGYKHIEKKLEKSSFFVLEPIDTANMGEKETIIANVSAEMYSKFKKIQNRVSVDKKRMFIESIKKVNDTAIFKTFGNWSSLGDRILSETDNAVHIKKLFEETVNNFLEIINNSSNRSNQYLVIQIDDLDMNVTNSFHIMEEIRNILSIKNVIVLLSVDIEQLKTVLRLHFEKSLSNKNEKKSNILRISKDLAHKYIEKIVPVNRRQYMPELDTDQLVSHVSENFLGDDDKNWTKMKLDGINKDNKSPTVMNAVLHLIWRKTLLIPMKNEYGDYILLPHNLRSLCNFIVFLRGMKDAAYAEGEFDTEKDEHLPLTFSDFADPEKGSSYREILENNLRMLNKYIITNLETCERPEMNTEDEKLTDLFLTLIETLSGVNINELNNKMVGDILRGFKDMNSQYYLAWLNNEKSVDTLIEATRYRDTISMGDLMYVLGKIDRKTHCGYIRYLIAVIRTLWSIKMTLEVYVNGCNPNNKNNCLTNSKYITESFRNSVGAMIVNPDTHESFHTDKKTKKIDWSISENKTKPAIYDLVVPKEEHRCVIFNSDSSYKIDKWRIHAQNIQPIYRKHYESQRDYCLSHPMALFSNLLYPDLIERDHNIYTGDFTRWQNTFIMAFPFYSMGYMCRLYEEFTNNIRLNVFSKDVSVMRFVLEQISKAAETILNETQSYIPFIPVPKLDTTSVASLNLNKDFPLDPIEKKHLLFQAPIEALIRMRDWDYDLVYVNKRLLEKLNEETKTIPNTIAMNEDDTNEYVNDLLKSIRVEIPYFFTDSDKLIHKLPLSTEKGVKQITNLLTAFEKGEKLIPLYYFDDSVYLPNRKKGNTSKKNNKKGNTPKKGKKK